MEKGDIAKIIISLLLFGFLIFLGTQIYTYQARANEAEAVYNTAKIQLTNAQSDENKLLGDLEYYSNPENLAKEIRARFNYHDPGEKTIILVPQSTTSAP